MSLPYFKKYPRDFFEGTVGMPFELKSAYGLIIDMIMMHDGTLMDDSGYISGLLGCSKRKWFSLRKGLLSWGKISVKSGLITNYRCDKEEITRRSYRDNQKIKGAMSNKNNYLRKVTEKPARVQPEPEPYKERIEDSVGYSKGALEENRQSRLENSLKRMACGRIIKS